MNGSATTPAAAPHPGESEARVPRIATCPCGNALGVDRDGSWRLHHRRRRWTLNPGLELADVFETVDCEACRREVPTADLDVHPYLPRAAVA